MVSAVFLTKNVGKSLVVVWYNTEKNRMTMKIFNLNIHTKQNGRS